MDQTNEVNTKHLNNLLQDKQTLCYDLQVRIYNSTSFSFESLDDLKTFSTFIMVTLNFEHLDTIIVWYPRLTC